MKMVFDNKRYFLSNFTYNFLLKTKKKTWRFKPVHIYAYLLFIHWEELFKGHSFEECQSCTINEHHRADIKVDVKPRPTEFGHHPIGQYGKVGQKLDFLSETGVIILKIDIDIS